MSKRQTHRIVKDPCVPRAEGGSTFVGGVHIEPIPRCEESEMDEIATHGEVRDVRNKGPRLTPGVLTRSERRLCQEIGDADCRAEKAEAALDEAIKQVAAMSDGMGKVEAERDGLREGLRNIVMRCIVRVGWKAPYDARCKICVGFSPQPGAPVQHNNDPAARCPVGAAEALLAEIDAAREGEEAGG